jgi:chromosome segregation ATPase
MTTDARALIERVRQRNASLKFGDPRYSCVVGSDELLVLLTGYSAALDSLESAHRHTDALERDKREACKTEEHLRTDLAEAKLVIEQQDRDLERMQSRQQELLATIVRLTNETPFPDEIKGWQDQRAKMVARIGTLESLVADLRTPMNEDRIDAILDERTPCTDTTTK